MTWTWRVPAALAVTVLTVVGLAPAGAAGGPDRAGRGVVAGLVAARAAGQDWRLAFGARLASLAELRSDRAPTDPLRGLVLADTLRLPARVELAGDTTILARTIEFAAGPLRIDAHGHDLTLLPVDAVRAGPLRLSAGRGATAMPAATEIVIDMSGVPGGPGTFGFDGIRGRDAFPGAPGTPAHQDCLTPAGNGGNGETGVTGDPGATGGEGQAGQPGSTINMDIPPGSQDTFRLISRGGAGGNGGPGGNGGQGGIGGDGGQGGPSFRYFCEPGTGGNAGAGGKGGNGGKGGKGGAGGNGGTITVSIPAGYDPSGVFTDAAGGIKGVGGLGGGPGLGNSPGNPGPGGENFDFCLPPCPDGPAGNPAAPGLPGSFGTIGADGTAGTAGRVTINAPPSIGLGTNKTVYETGDVPTYTVIGAPNAQIMWSTWKDGVPLEQDVFRGDVTDGLGRWSGQGPAWSAADVSDDWRKQVRIAGQTAQATFRVIPRPPVEWVGWTDVPGLTVADQIAWHPAPGENGTAIPSVQIFARGSDNGIYRNRYWRPVGGSAHWSGWVQMDGAMTAAPVVVDRQADRTELYVRGTDGAIYRRTGDVLAVPEAWQGWQGLGGYAQGRPAVVSQNAAWLMVFIRGGDNQLYVNRLVVNTWSGWQPLGGSLTADPVAVAHGSSGTFVTVFTRGAAGEVNYRRWNGSAWEGWVSLGGWVDGSGAAVTRDTNKIYLLHRGGGGVPYLNLFDGSGWTGWQPLGGVLTSDPAAAGYRYVPGQSPTYNNRVIVAARGTDNAVHVNSAQVGDAWGGWRGIGGVTALPVTVATVDGAYFVLAVDPVTGMAHHRTGNY